MPSHSSFRFHPSSFHIHLKPLASRLLLPIDRRYLDGLEKSGFFGKLWPGK
jgi:hypothetical protein